MWQYSVTETFVAVKSAQRYHIPCFFRNFDYLTKVMKTNYKLRIILLLSHWWFNHESLWVVTNFHLSKSMQTVLILNSFVYTDTIIRKGGNSFFLKLASSVLRGNETWYTWLIVQCVPFVLPHTLVTVSVPFASMKHRC